MTRGGVALCALALSAASASAWSQANEPVSVEVEQARLAQIAPKRWAPGGVVARNDARLATSGAGRLEFVAEVGTRVRAGDRVAKLEDEAVRLRVADAAAEVARIEAQRSIAQRQLQRIEQLANNSVSQTQLDDVRGQVAMLSAQLEQAQVRRRAAEHDLQQTDVRAPFPGIVTERLAQRGEYVATGAAIARLVDTVHVEARVQAPLALVNLVRPNMPVTVKAGGNEFQATVRTVVPVGDERSRQFELRLTLPDSTLAVGSSLEVGLPEKSAVAAVVVPRDAIAVRQEGSYLMRVRPDGTAERVDVKQETSDGELVSVRGDLNEGDAVVTRGVERLQQGQKVKVTTRGASNLSRSSTRAEG